MLHGLIYAGELVRPYVAAAKHRTGAIQWKVMDEKM